MTNKIKVLVVDDSAFMRRAITMMLSEDSGIEVIDTAVNGKEAVEKVKNLRPDVVTLDIEMPIMDGLEALREIMKFHPLPVIMISSLTTEGADATMEALNLGAVDFIPKKMSYVSPEIINIKNDLILKINYFHQNRISVLAKLKRRSKTPTLQKPAITKKEPSQLKPVIRKKGTEIVVIGSSTGGPQALQKVIPKLPLNMPVPVIIVQHMPKGFTKSLADRLDALSELSVVEASNGDILSAGKVYIAPGGMQLSISKFKKLLVTEEPKEILFRPSVDVTLKSATEIFGKQVLSVIMTGMGSDGTKAIKSLADIGGSVIGQDEESCVVYGMPKIPNEKGYSKVIVPLDNISDEIMKNL